MKEIKIIDLLNMIAEGKEVPKKFIYNDHVWCWCEPCNIYETIEEKETINLYDWFSDEGNLNDTVEIIEEDNNKIEKIDITDKSICVKGTRFFRDKDIEIFQKLSMVINEIIDKINNME